jgi:hypothetical protein
MVNEAEKILMNMRAAAFMVLALGVTGCDALVGLGPSASLLDASSEASPEASPADATMPDGGSSVEAGSEASAPEAGYPCGLQMRESTACDTCDVASCCQVNIDCSKNARCAEGAMKLQQCVYDAVCVTQVDNDYADTGVLDLQNCTISNCSLPCFPMKNCLQLATCCKQIPSNLPSALQTCIATVNKLDENGCQNILDNVLRNQLGAQFCTGANDAGPADAGGD